MSKTIKLFIFCAVACLSASLLVERSHAQTNSELKICQNTTADPNDVIRACGVFIRTRRAVNGSRAPAAAMSSIFFLRGYAYARKGDTESALSDYSEALDLNPKNVAVYGFRGQAYIALGKLDQAVEAFDEVISRSKEKNVMAEGYGNRGYVHFKRSEFNEAIADLSQAIQYNPKYAYAYRIRGMAYEYLRDTARADIDYEELARLTPNNKSGVEDDHLIERSWISYLAEIQEDNDYANWTQPPLDMLRGGAAPQIASLPTGDGSCADAAIHWKSVELIGTRAAYEDHRARFPNCAFAGLAKARIASLSGRPAKTCPAGQALDSDGDCVKQKPARREARTPSARTTRTAPQEGGGRPALDCTTPAGLFACANRALQTSPIGAQ